MLKVTMRGACMRRIAAIDIGTVTMRLLIADIDEQGIIREVLRDICLTHVGKNLTETGELHAEGMQRAFEAQERFAGSIAAHHVEQVIGVATSATRDASNSDEFLWGLSARGLDVHIIEGEREAALSFAGATYGRSANDLLVIDPGGGSTECVFAHDAGAKLQLRSLDIGSRRLTDMFMHEQRATSSEMDATRVYVRRLFEPYFEQLDNEPAELVAVAGTATSLVTIAQSMQEYDPARVHGQKMSIGEIDAIIEQLAQRTVEERKDIVGLEPKRASVILAGVIIIDEILKATGLNSVTISDYDILYGIILSADLF